MQEREVIRSKSEFFGWSVSRAPRSGYLRDQLYTLLVIAIFILAIGLRLIGLNKGFWLDEYYSIRWLNQGDFWQTTEALRNYNKPPLYFLLFYLWAQINSSEPFLRILSIIFDLGTIFIIIKWLKPYSRLASILAGVYFATTPLILRYAQEIRPYSLLVLATALGFYCTSLIIKYPQRKINYLGLAGSLSLAVSSHLVGIMLILPIGAIAIIGVKSKHSKLNWLGLFFSLIVPSLVFSYFYFFFLEGLDKIAEAWWMPEVSWYLIASTFRYVFNLPNNLNLNLVFGGFIILILSINFWSRSKQSFSWLLIIAALIFWLEIIIYSVFKTSIFWYRVVLPGIVPFIGFVCLQVAAIKKHRTRYLYTFGILSCCLIFSLNWISGLAKEPVEEYRAVTQVIKEAWQPNDLVIIAPGFIFTTINYYLDGTSRGRNLIFYNTSNYDQLPEKINKKVNDSNITDNIFLVVRDLETEFYEHLLSAISTQIKQPTNIYLLTILNHDTYFENREDTREEIIKITQEKLGEYDFYRAEKLYSIALWK